MLRWISTNNLLLVNQIKYMDETTTPVTPTPVVPETTTVTETETEGTSTTETTPAE